MKWLLNRNGFWTIEIWPSKAAEALSTLAMAKAWMRLDGLPKKSVS